MWHFHGCSLSTDNYVKNKDDAYPRLVGKHFNQTVDIKAVMGNSNQTIFSCAIDSLLDDSVNTVFVQITTPGRQAFYHDYKCITSTLGKTSYEIPNKKWQTFLDVFNLLDQEYNQFVLLSHYVPRLAKLASITGKHLHFINGYMTIDPIFFSDNKDVNYYLLNDDTKRILNFSNKPDDNIAAQIVDIKQKLACMKDTSWVTIVNPLRDYAVDKGLDGLHPGVKSNKIFAEIIIEYLEKKHDR